MSSEHVEVLRDLSEVFRAAIKAGDWKVDGACDPDAVLRRADSAIAALSAPQPPAEAQPVAFDRRFADMLIGVIGDVQDELGFTDEDKACANGSAEIVAAFRELKERAAAPPSAPVGVGAQVSALQSARDRMMAALTPKFGDAFDGDFDVMLEAINTMKRFRMATLAQQPAADGGFSAADMMDARKEGRQEAQQPAGFSAGDMADAAAQGFRDGVASVEAAAVDEAMVERAMDAAMEIKHNKETWFPMTRRRMKRALTAALAAQQGGSDDR